MSAIAAGTHRAAHAPRAARHRPPAARAGFSLIEILGVLVVLALIATIVGINWKAILPRTELHSAVRTLASTLQGARSDAIARNLPFEVEYDLSAGRYRLLTPFKEDGGVALRDEDRKALAWKMLPESVRFESITIGGLRHERAMLRVRFDPLGTSTGHTVVLQQLPELSRHTIEVQGLLGLISHHEGLFEREPPREEDFR